MSDFDSDNSTDHIERWLEQDHLKALQFAKQCFLLRIVTGLEAFMKESLLMNPSVAADIIEAVKDVECKGWIFNINEKKGTFQLCRLCGRSRLQIGRASCRERVF